MAEDSTSPDKEDTVQGLREKLEERRELLGDIRAERAALEREAADAVTMEGLRREIFGVEQEIAVEVEQLKNQKRLDPRLVATGVATEGIAPPPEVVNAEEPVLETLAYGAVAQPLDPAVAEKADDDDNTEGSEK